MMLGVVVSLCISEVFWWKLLDPRLTGFHFHVPVLWWIIVYSPFLIVAFATGAFFINHSSDIPLFFACAAASAAFITFALAVSDYFRFGHYAYIKGPALMSEISATFWIVIIESLIFGIGMGTAFTLRSIYVKL